MRTGTRLLVFFGALIALGAALFALLWLRGVPSLGVAGVLSSEQRRTEVAIEALADKERDRFERWFDVQRRELRLFANSDALIRPHGNTEAARLESLSRQLMAIQSANFDAYRRLYLANATGTELLLSAGAELPRVPRRDLSLLSDAAQPGMSESVSLIDAEHDHSVLIINQVPELNAEGLPSGRVLRLLVASLALLGPLEEQDSVLRQSLGEHGAVLLLGHDGKVMAERSQREGRNYAYVSEAHARGSEGLKLLKDAQGVEHIVVYRHLHVGAAEGLSLVLLRSTDEALAASRAVFWRVGLLGGTMFVLAMLLVLFAARSLQRGEDEVRALNASLEARVAARTSDLADSNRQLSETLFNLQEARDVLMRTEKLAALGALVAGVAHDLNTPIGNALLTSSALKDSAEDFYHVVARGVRRAELTAHLEHNKAGLDMLVANLQRAADLIEGFKQLSADHASDQRRVFTLRQVIDEVVVSMAPALRRTGYGFRQELFDDIRFDSYPGPLGRIIVNFIGNALLHAFEHRASGEMHLSARRLDDSRCELKFSDNGVGMAPEVARRVFDPYFTTKLGKGGSGLGMHIAYNLVTNLLGGEIKVETALGEGTAFILILPICAPQHTAADTNPVPLAVMES